jgi:hypothetical protein
MCRTVPRRGENDVEISGMLTPVSASRFRAERADRPHTTTRRRTVSEIIRRMWR